MARDLVVRQTLAAVVDQRFGGELHLRFQHNTCSDELSPLRIRDSENRHFAHGWMIEDHGLHLTAIHVFTTRDDHVLLAVEYVEIAIDVLITDISGTKEAVSESSRGLLFIVPVPTHHVRTARNELTLLAVLDWIAQFIRNLNLDSRARPTAGCEVIIRMVFDPVDR